MMKVIRSAGRDDIATVHIADMGSGRLVEFVESTQPPLDRSRKWVLIISVLFGCPVGCWMCDAGDEYRGRLSKDELFAQIDYLIRSRYPDGVVPVEKFKIQFARMGEPALNPAVIDVLEEIQDRYHIPGFIPSISTVAPAGSEAFFERLLQVKQNRYPGGRFQLQFSIHTTDPELRDRVVPVRKWDFSRIAELKGQKRFVVAASGADFFVVYCMTNPDGNPHDRISLILIEADREGVETKHLYNLLGTRGGGTGRLIFKDVKVPASNLIGELNQGALIFNSMMVPERLTSAGMAIGLARAALEVATRYSNRRYAFGRKIRDYQAISFKVADAITQLDAARAITHAAGKAADEGIPSARRLVSEAKKFATDVCWEVCNHSMRIIGGIGYTNVFPIEKMVRDARLTQIWTGTNEIMSLLIQHEYYKELLNDPNPPRMSEEDAEESHLEDEKVYEDGDMWTKGW